MPKLTPLIVAGLMSFAGPTAAYAQAPASPAPAAATTASPFPLAPPPGPQIYPTPLSDLLIHILNGHMMCEVIDDDTVNRKFSGLIGVQVHVGPPMKIEYRRILLKELP